MITTVYGLMSSPLAPTVSIEQRHLKDVICTKLCSAFSDEHSANGKNQDHATDEQSYLQTVVDIGAALSDLTALFTAAKAVCLSHSGASISRLTVRAARRTASLPESGVLDINALP